MRLFFGLILTSLLFASSLSCNDSLVPHRRLTSENGSVSLGVSFLATSWKNQHGQPGQRLLQLRIINERNTDFTYNNVIVDVSCDNSQARLSNLTIFRGGTVLSNLVNMVPGRVRATMNVGEQTIGHGYQDFIDVALDTSGIMNSAGNNRVKLTVSIFAISANNGQLIKTAGQTLELNYQ